MTPIVRFDRVGKHYILRRNRPRSFREAFVQGRLLKTQGANNSVDTLWALRDVSFEIQPGETVGLVGANGAGKSTTLKLISRVVVPNSGRVTVGGRVGALLELGTGFHPDLSGRDNIHLSGALAGMSRKEIQRKYSAIVDFSELEQFIDMPVKHYSSGMYARLAFAVSIHIDPQILLVDEVLAVGDQNFQQKCLDRIAELQKRGVTICLVSHALDTVRALCQRALWFDHGRLLADGPADNVVGQYLDFTVDRDVLRLAGGARAHDFQRWGSRQVELTGVRLTDEHGLAQSMFATGERLCLHMDYTAHEPVAAPVFGLAIYRNDGLHICGPNTDFGGLRLEILQGRGTITYAIPVLPLLEGLYQISVTVQNQTGTEVYDYHDRAYSFRVVNHGTHTQEKYGVVTLQGEWSQSTAPALAQASS